MGGRSTVISYSLAEDARVQLDVFDILGRRVTTLVDDVQPAGAHTVTWDGRTSSGEGVASGMYFYRLSAGRFVQAKKMILLK